MTIEEPETPEVEASKPEAPKPPKVEASPAEQPSTPAAEPEEQPVDKVQELQQAANDKVTYGIRILSDMRKDSATAEWKQFGDNAIKVANQTQEVSQDQMKEAATIEYDFLKENIPLWFNTSLKPMFIARLQRVTEPAQAERLTIPQMEELAKQPVKSGEPSPEDALLEEASKPPVEPQRTPEDDLFDEASK